MSKDDIKKFIKSQKNINIKIDPKTGKAEGNLFKKEPVVSNNPTIKVGQTLSGKIDFRVDKSGIIHASIGKVSFDADKIYENSLELIQNILKLKPSSSKGTYLKGISMSSTMSPGLNVDTNFS